MPAEKDQGFRESTDWSEYMPGEAPLRRSGDSGNGGQFRFFEMDFCSWLFYWLHGYHWLDSDW